MYYRTVFDSLLSRDDVPQKDTDLWRQFKKNPRLLRGEVGKIQGSDRSVVSLTLALGNLNLADCLLKLGGNSFVAGADPFYLGKVDLHIESHLQSPCVNFYCALTVWQLYFQQNRLPELASITSTQEIDFKKTYYELFYWENENNVRCYSCDGANMLEQHTFMHAQAEWFMQIAYKIFQLETELNKILAYKETWMGKLSDMFVVDNKAHEICVMLSDYYLHIAYMETSSRGAFAYFTRKAHDYCVRSLDNCSNRFQKLTELTRQISSDPGGQWLRMEKERLASLRGCVIATKDYSAADVWSKAFNLVHETILNEDIPSSLHFMETHSNRTSLTTSNNSQDSGEFNEKQAINSGITVAGLHKRHKAAEIINPIAAICRK